MKTRNAQRWTAGLMMALGLMGCATAGPTAVSAPPAQAAAPTSVVVETVVAPTVDVVDRGWMDFNDNREGYTALVAGVLLDCANAEGTEQSPDCVRRRGSFEVAYALSALYRMTHDPTYLDAADAAIDTKALGRLERLDAYEASFFLALATERERTKRRTDLHAGAEQVAKQLEVWLTDADDYSFAQRSMFGNEENAAVVLGRLWDWADLTADDELRDRLRTLTERRFVGVEMDSWCPQPVDCEPEGFEFLPPCLQRASTVLSVVPGERSNPWLEAFLAKQSELEPIIDARLSTHEALNFTRAASLWRVYEATGESKYRAKYVQHLAAGMEFLQRQQAAGEAVDPWHAAFAVHALAVSDR